MVSLLGGAIGVSRRAIRAIRGNERAKASVNFHRWQNYTERKRARTRALVRDLYAYYFIRLHLRAHQGSHNCIAGRNYDQRRARYRVSRNFIAGLLC